MTEPSQEEKAAQGASQANPGANDRNGTPEEKFTSISSYFLDPKASPSALIKAIKHNRVKRFALDDEARALELLATTDPDGKRLWALISQAALPDAIGAWIWRACQARLVSVVGPGFDPSEHDAARLLKSLLEVVSPKLKSKDKHERSLAENWLRIGVCWLMEKRSLDAWIVADALLPVLFSDDKRALQASRRAIQRGRPNEFRIAAAMAGPPRDMVRTAQADRDTEKRLNASLRHQLAEDRSTTQQLRDRISVLEAQLAEATRGLRAAEHQLETERQHWGHDLSETKAEQRMLLSERLAPLISDAIDALEIDPAAPNVALKRLKTVLSLVGGEKS